MNRYVIRYREPYQATDVPAKEVTFFAVSEEEVRAKVREYYPNVEIVSITAYLSKI